MTTTAAARSKDRFECRFAVYCPPPSVGMADYHMVKEVVHKPDGTTVPNVRLVKDMKVPFYLTKKGQRTHKDKKEWEYLKNLEKFETRECDKIHAIARALETPWFNGNLRKLHGSPYVYGSDILSTAVLKRRYQDQFPELNTHYSVATFDTETDVLHGTNEIIMATLSMGKRVFTAVTKRFLEGHTNVIPQLRQKLQKYLGAFEKEEKGEIKLVDILAERGIEWEVIIVNTELDVVTECFARAHAWKPDFLAVWNIDFDMTKLLEACKRRRIDPKDVFSDPSIPPAYRHFTYKRGASQKVTASGKITPIPVQQRWHSVFCPSSFYFIDAMCSYSFVRTGAGLEPSYGLDAILNKHLGIRKLKFKEADHVEKIDWHILMQEKYPLEYVIYNVFDCISMEMLDESTLDLRLSLPLQSGCSDFQHFRSQPRRTADNLHYFVQNRAEPRIIGTTSNDMATEFDKETIGLEGWITTLPAHLVADNGLQLIEEAPHIRTNIRGHVGDLDVSASCVTTRPSGESLIEEFL